MFVAHNRGGLRAANTPPAVRLTVLSAGLLLAFGASAQSAPAPEAAASSPNTPPSAIQTVTITAEHRVENIQKTSIAVTAIGGDEALEKGATNIGSALNDVPALNIQGSQQGGQIFIRGVGSNGDSNWIDSAVSLNIDNVYTAHAERVFSAMYDVNRVEVLRGPQGTLYGRNATGGSVNVITNDPGKKFGGDFNVQIGNYNLHHEDGALNVPLTGTLYARVALLREQRDGYFSNGGRASDLKGARLKLLYKPTSTFSLLAAADDLQSYGKGSTSVPRTYTAGPSWTDWKADYSSPWDVDPEHPADQQHMRFDTFSLQANWDLGFGTLTFIPSYEHSWRNTYGNLIAGTAETGDDSLLGNVGQRENQFTQELRLSSPASSSTKWVFGLYNYKSANASSGNAPSDSPPSYDVYGIKNPATSKAVFGQATMPVAEGVRLTGGLRYTHDVKSDSYGIHSNIGSYDSGLQTASTSNNAFTYKAGAEVDLAAESMLYVQATSGYKAGGYSTNAYPGVAYKPEHLTAFELGSKNRFLDDTVQLNAELYLYKYRDYQVQYNNYAAASPNADDAAGTTTTALLVTNASTGTNYGGEVEVRWRVVPTTELSANLSYTHARYGEFEASSGLSYLDHRAVASTPSYQLQLGIDHQVLFDNGDDIALGFDTKFSAGYRVGVDENLPGGDGSTRQGAFHKSNLHATYEPASGKWSAGLWARNLENKAQNTLAQPWGRTIITDPRTFGVNASYKF